MRLVERDSSQMDYDMLTPRDPEIDTLAVLIIHFNTEGPSKRVGGWGYRSNQEVPKRDDSKNTGRLPLYALFGSASQQCHRRILCRRAGCLIGSIVF